MSTKGQNDTSSKKRDVEDDENGKTKESKDNGLTTLDLIVDILKDTSKAAIESVKGNDNKIKEGEEEANAAVIKKSSISLDPNDLETFQQSFITTEDDPENMSSNEVQYLAIDKRSEIPGSNIKKTLPDEIRKLKYPLNDLISEIPNYSAQASKVNPQNTNVKEIERHLVTKPSERTTVPVFQATIDVKKQNKVYSEYSTNQQVNFLSLLYLFIIRK